jgi:hypothetical protein
VILATRWGAATATVRPLYVWWIGFSEGDGNPFAEGPNSASSRIEASQELRPPSPIPLKIGIETSRCLMRIAESFGPVREGIDLATRATRAIGAALVPQGQTIPDSPILL